MQTQSPENRTILIASCSVDEPTWQPVAKRLAEGRYEVVVFEADKVALQDVPFEILINKDDGFVASYDGRKLCLDAISAAWFRRPSFITDPRVDGATQMSLDMERRLLQSALWGQLPEQTWLNSPDKISQSERKLSQLNKAQQLGFVIPPTIAANTWSAIQEVLPRDIICKPSYSIFYDGSDYKPLYTTPFVNDSSKLPLNLDPYPGIWQKALRKTREWRITVVGDETFDAAIYTDEYAKDDWRKHQLISGGVEFRKESFPDALKEKCFSYLGAFGLRFGAFDFVEDSDQITFLECNPNGQFMWLEMELGLPISGAISSELIKIARGS